MRLDHGLKCLLRSISEASLTYWEKEEDKCEWTELERHSAFLVRFVSFLHIFNSNILMIRSSKHEMVFLKIFRFPFTCNNKKNPLVFIRSVSRIQYLFNTTKY